MENSQILGAPVPPGHQHLHFPCVWTCLCVYVTYTRKVRMYVCRPVCMYVFGRSQWPCGLRRVSTAAHLLGLRVRIPQGVWMSASCECRGLWVGLILSTQESYRVCVTEVGR